MGRDYTLSATPRPPSLSPLGPPSPGWRARLAASPKLRTLRTCAAALTMLSFALGVPLLASVSLGMPILVGMGAWVANAVVAWLLVSTAPPSEYRPLLRPRSGPYEPGGVGAYYAYQDFRDCGGDGGG